MRFAAMVVGLLCISAPVRAADYEITPPAGWVRDDALSKQGHDSTAAVELVSHVVVDVWRPGDGSPGLLQVQSFVLALDSRSDLTDFDLGLVKSLKGQGTTKSDDPIKDTGGGVFLGDLKVDVAGGHFHTVRRYAHAKDGTHGLLTMCVAADATSPCEAAISAVTFTVASTPFSSGGIGDLSPYRVGQIVGGALVIAALVTFLVRRSRK